MNILSTNIWFQLQLTLEALKSSTIEIALLMAMEQDANLNRIMQNDEIKKKRVDTFKIQQSVVKELSESVSNLEKEYREIQEKIKRLVSDSS
jgi:hypothetical protein